MVLQSVQSAVVQRTRFDRVHRLQTDNAYVSASVVLVKHFIFDVSDVTRKRVQQNALQAFLSFLTDRNHSYTPMDPVIPPKI